MYQSDMIIFVFKIWLALLVIENVIKKVVFEYEIAKQKKRLRAKKGDQEMKNYYFQVVYDPKDDDIIPTVKMLRKTYQMIADEEEDKWRKLGILGKEEENKKKNDIDLDIFR